jgi:hypothetical protein
LSFLHGHVATKSNLLHCINEFGDRTFLEDLKLTVLDTNSQTTGPERPNENDLSAVLTDVNEAAAAGNAFTEFARIDIAVSVRLSHAEECNVEPTAINKIESRRVI